ncbi:alpha/beta-hydrolase [Acrasis kona]|uniref:Alpha/beta-hydrolase n=1 Tax=Acrasis kona TaxID=1008807 RepID=A0AAW2Z0G6_9EUKA
MEVEQTQLNQIYTLSDGRKIGFAQYGPSDSYPIIYCHGTPSSRLEAALWDTDENVRIISIDRPGFGLSTFQDNRTVLDWPKDVSELLDHLKIEQFSMIAVSGGTAYALACARHFSPTQLKSVAIVAGMGPQSMGLDGMCFGQKVTFFFTTWTPFIIRPFINTLYLPLSKKPDLADIFRKSATCEVDKKVMQDDQFTNDFAKAFKESFSQGSEAYVHESKLFVAEWGFSLKEVQCQHVNFYYGDKDDITPAAMGHKMSQSVTNSNIYIFKEETHSSIIYNHKRQIIHNVK